ncbi:MAG: hypothetical protein IT242_08955 [Bacteroidia bacterium]|nr:hypothetical protein [Bacteroidia bacterium]
MKAKTILIIVLSAGSLLAALEALDISDILDRDSEKTILLIPPACNDSARYDTTAVAEEPGGGTTVSEDEATKLIVTFFDKVSPRESKRRGGYFSKRAIDKIFTDDKTATGISFYYAMDSRDSLTMIMTPAYCKTTGIDTTVKTLLFLSGTFCPDQCGVIPFRWE